MCEKFFCYRFSDLAEYHMPCADLKTIPLPVLCVCALFDVSYCRELVERAWVDMQRFKEQKDKDLQEALINYAVMQISMCKKVQNSTSAI